MIKTWEQFIKIESQKAYYQKLMAFLALEEQTYSICPNRSLIFKAFELTDLMETKVVIIGQDPYPNLYQAMGLAFSVPSDQKIPPTLKNIYKELANDLGYQIPISGDLTNWALQGVLLLNTILTVRSGKSLSHKNQGWEEFTDQVIKLLNQQDRPIVFILWGNYALDKLKYLTNPHHLIIKSPHPSGLSAHRGFWGSAPFSQTIKFLNDPKLDFKVRH